VNTKGDTNTPPRGAPSGVGRSPDATSPIAAIDIGTNSLHLVIARIREGGGFEIISREKEMVRLGAGSRAMKQLESTAMDRGIAALDRFRRMADAIGAPITAVATSAVREATNRSEFVSRARDEAGLAIEVVSGIEEARLIRL
jgi:exopolyphosphatase/guanosine-5'-triphosphate,3'-diphosphate pyrophosphatase